jgi:hypothetical protein
MSVPQTEPPEKKFAADRSHQDAQTSNDFQKNLCQILLAVNGFAGTAIMTYSGTHEPQVRIPPIALASSTLAFLFGVISALLASLTCLEMSQSWASKWQAEAQDDKERRKEMKEKAMKLQKKKSE